ncbi:zinc metalloprotease [Roseateles koreensis]|uniref:Uncharacterized protein n=1 Tax=Roseateles koreensis TaxID=2987526 RepID=A0ABT5KPL3_9BURK|nr:hypothetical protein [Roseateles koreensis]MDC8784862.1 hypothetical protein [Roseateles koreensis]
MIARTPSAVLGQVLGLMLSLPLAAAAQPQQQAGPSIREQEIAECRPGEIQTWGDGTDHPAVAEKLIFVYDHRGAPPWFSARLVMAALQRAAEAWSRCGVPSLVAQGVMSPALMAVNKGNVQVLWSDAETRGNFALANLSQRRLALSPAGFVLLKTRNPSYPAQETLQMAISHEMGHLYGLGAHSRRCVDVTSYYDNGKGDLCSARDRSQLKTVVEYRANLPTACDLQRCRMANGQAQAVPGINH